jgi:hypothetical protein
MTEPNDGPSSDETDNRGAHVRENTAGWTVTTQVATGVADALGTTPDDLTPIERVLDADALNQLFVDGGDAGVTVTFDYESCRVTVDAEEIRVDPPHHTL